MEIFVRIFFPVLLIAFVSASCKRDIYVKFEITNSTQSKIDSLSIQPNNDTTMFISINSNEMKEYICDMNKMPLVDGAYGISYKMDSTSRTQVFGYYTNGYPLDKLFRINIQSDTIIIKSIE